MNTKTGIVTQIKKNKIIIITNTGEFVEVKKDKSPLSIGSIYSGKVIDNSIWQRIVTTAASLLFILLISTEAYAYYTPTSTILLKGSLDAKIEINKWDRIISVEGTNKESTEILNSIDIKYSNIEDGLGRILETNNNINKSEDNLKITIRLEDNQNSDMKEKLQNILINNKNIINSESNTKDTDQMKNSNVNNENQKYKQNINTLKENTQNKDKETKNINDEKKESNQTDKIKTNNNQTNKESKNQDIQNNINDNTHNKNTDKKPNENLSNDTSTNNISTDDNNTNSNAKKSNTTKTNTEKSNHSKETPKTKDNKLK